MAAQTRLEILELIQQALQETAVMPEAIIQAVEPLAWAEPLAWVELLAWAELLALIIKLR